MSSDNDDLLRPPSRPFYAEKDKPKRRRHIFTNMRPEFYERLRKALAEELVKPVAERTGKLRTFKSGDLSDAELAAIKKRYNLT